MSIFKKLFKKPIVVDFYTDRVDLYNYARPVKASKTFPEWWKNLPIISNPDPIDPRASMKGCVGFLDLYANGFVLPIWSDLNVVVGPAESDFYQWKYADNLSNAEVHIQHQRGDYLPPSHYQHLKLICPWACVCKEDIQWVFLGAMWNFEKPEDVLIPPAVVDFKHQALLNVNMFFPKGDKERMISFEQGQPLVHIIPMTDRPVVFNYHLVSTKELKTYDTALLWFNKAYKKRKAAMGGKCPF